MTNRRIFLLITIAVFFVVCFSCDRAKKKETIASPPKEITGKDGAPMVLIPAGEFQMGTDAEEIPELVQWVKKKYQSGASTKSSWFEKETPRHIVYLDAFYMDKYEVTNAQYRRFVQATGHGEPEGDGYDELGSRFKPWADRNFSRDDQPVVCVSWEDAKAYAEWAGKRLPTEAEWEKAARGGLVGKRFPWGDEALDASGICRANYSLFGVADDGYEYTAPVGSFVPNGYGLYDMIGNVWEWCADWYADNYYADSPKENPKGPDSGDRRVLRGGACIAPPSTLRVACRRGRNPTSSYYGLGFRCVSQD